jgi:hypothetical protein
MSIADLWVVLTVVGFFGLCVALVRGCDRIIGSDEGSELAEFDDSTPSQLDELTGEVGAQ